MPHKIYVGNYPINFSEDDVLNLFQDFDRIDLVGFFRNKNKCYSFLHCISERQLIEIVANLHDIDVCGRNLIVRAADENLHKRIQNSISKYGAANFHPRNTCDVNSSTSFSENNETFDHSKARSSKQSSPQVVDSYSGDNGGKKYEMGHFNAGHSTSLKRIFKSNKGDSNNYKSHDYSAHSSEFSNSSLQGSHYSENSSSAGREGNKSYCNENASGYERKTSDLAINPQDTFSRISKPKTENSGHYKTMNERFDSYKKPVMHGRENSARGGHQPTNLGKDYPPRSRNASESLETVHNKPRAEECTNLSCISVVNFPLYLPIRDLYKLFSDFNPVKVVIVCNEPRMDKTPTEAIICFQSEKDATDAILTLDNTIYQGRVLIVTDAVDMSLVSELLSFG